VSGHVDEKGETAVLNTLRERLGRCSILLVVLLAPGCQSSPINLAEGIAPWRQPRPDGAESFEDSLSGGEVFAMYCNQCHYARNLGERPFSSYQNVAAHMRVRANLTGEEYAKLMEFLRRWHDVPPPTPAVEPSPKRMIFSQPVAELRDEQAAPPRPAAGAQPQPGAVAAPALAPAAARPQPAPAPPPVIPEPLPPR
jgi:hypothetical protein